MEMTYTDLLDRLSDLDALTMPPLSGERSGCFSSYDRQSKYLPEQDRYVDWDANDDGGGIIRELEDGSVVAVELNGPGVIWRSWSAMPRDGHIRVYIDGGLVIDRPFIQHFTQFSDDYAPMNTPDISPLISRGYNTFIPIPFNESIRIEFAPGWGRYYHFTYTQFPEGTQMPRYQDAATRQGRIALAKLDRKLHLRAVHSFAPAISKTIGANSAETVFESSNSGMITQLQLRIQDPAAANTLLIKMYWDGENEPAVCAPVCDFFGTAPEMTPFATWLCGYTGGVLYARWHMPFSDGARIELENLAGTPAAVEAAIECVACECASARLRFRAKWHTDHFDGLERAEFEPSGQRFPDWPILRTNGGAGRFCGVHLRILDMWRNPGDAEAGEWWFGHGGSQRLDWWWGEGDEKFFVDDEKFPSTFGTGSEDYIGYAWAADPPFALFDSPFAAMSAMPLDGNGVTSVCRFHVCDNVPFEHSFEAYIEKYKGNIWGEDNRCQYGATAYWYQAAGTEKDNYPTPDVATLQNLTVSQAL